MRRTIERVGARIGGCARGVAGAPAERADGSARAGGAHRGVARRDDGPSRPDVRLRLAQRARSLDDVGHAVAIAVTLQPPARVGTACEAARLAGEARRPHDERATRAAGRVDALGLCRPVRREPEVSQQQRRAAAAGLAGNGARRDARALAVDAVAGRAPLVAGSDRTGRRADVPFPTSRSGRRGSGREDGDEEQRRRSDGQPGATIPGRFGAPWCRGRPRSDEQGLHPVQCGSGRPSRNGSHSA